MATNFSGTDYEQLKLACQSNPYYLSVVVNNVLDFTAKVAIESKEVLNGYSYFKTPNNKEVKTPKTYTKTTFEVIEVGVECQWPDYMLTVDEQINNIQKYSPAPTYANGYSWNSPAYNAYSHNQQYKNNYQKRDAWELPLQYYDAPKTTPASKPAVPVVEEEDEYELYAQHIETIVEVLKTEKLDYKKFADTLLSTCDEAGIPYQFLWEYLLTETVISEEYDNKVVEYLEPIIYKEVK